MNRGPDGQCHASNARRCVATPLNQRAAATACTAAPPDGDAQRQAQPYSAADAYHQTHNEAGEAVMPEERIGLRSGSTRMSL